MIGGTEQVFKAAFHQTLVEKNHQNGERRNYQTKICFEEMNILIKGIIRT